MGTKFEDLEKNSAKKLTGIGVVVFLHILVGLVLMAGMAKDIIKPTEQPVELMIIQDIKPPEPEPPKETPPEPPKIVEKVAQVPEVKPVEKVVPVQKTLPTPTQPTTVAVPTPVAASPSPSPVAAPAPVVAAAPAPAPPPAGVTRGVSQGEAGCKRPDYPRDALMNEEQGEVLISVYVNTSGKVQDAKVKKSSGSRALDRAASKAFSLCTFKPAMKNGEPQESWYDIPYEFVLD
ncbi:MULTISPECIES: energy transducer TonB [Acinetobacter]|uniref:energy transducer TonB n=1 Tax=Acinetobacter TaxID=469 RepID=UPI000A320582|nr:MULTISPECIES: energy transducer TonB [Acinetobacter]AUC05883.1 energy transducer TonB [Acinetobacter lwoffii]MCO8062685.1 energy transducer TonB [Acinetobacter lwoffii]MCO8080526.1 energy transducer TonB [Acinetobacter lwoffii]RDC52816.1 energy transducer TonB [Acinetobacter sp. RIT592]